MFTQTAHIKPYTLISSIARWKYESKIHEIRKHIRRLVAFGLRDHQGCDLLHLLCKTSTCYHSQAVSLVRLMIEEGTNVRNVDDDENDCLHFLIYLNGELINSAIVELLLENGTHWDAKNKAGCSFLDLIRSGHWKRQSSLNALFVHFVEVLVCSSCATPFQD